jgi:hypothetical protein
VTLKTTLSKDGRLVYSAEDAAHDAMRAHWYRLLLQLAIVGRLTRNRRRGYVVLLDADYALSEELSCQFDDIGLPIHTPELEQALRQALEESK